MRGRFLLFAPVVLVGCVVQDSGDGYDPYGGSEIVFGIRQATEASTGRTEVTAGYEYLGLANQSGWTTTVFRDGDGDGTCYFERLDHRLGRPYVESGVATWTGGALPSPGLQVLANQPDVSKHEGAGWQTHDTLFFDASGFAMPPLAPVGMRAPRTELEITGTSPALAEGASELSIASTDAVGVAWTPPESDAGRVMISLSTDEAAGPGGNVRCFTHASIGSATIPPKWVARLFSSVDPGAPVKGRLEVASHRQVTIAARGSWTVYVVATSLHREQAFTGVR